MGSTGLRWYTAQEDWQVTTTTRAVARVLKILRDTKYHTPVQGGYLSTSGRGALSRHV